MAVVQLDNSQSRLDFFQQRTLHAIEHWASHDAVQQVEVKVLDLKRETILRAIALGLEFEPAWPIVRRLIIAFTPYMERRGYWDAWQGILEQAIGIAQTVSDVDAETTLTALLARLCQRMSRPDDVGRHYRRVIRLAKRTGNRFEEARACSNLGYLYIDRGQWWRSEVLSLHALTVFENLESDHGQAHTHNHLGVLYTRNHTFSKADTNLRRACQLWSVMNDEHGKLVGHLNLGLLYIQMGKPQKAIPKLLIALNSAQATGDVVHTGNIYNNLGLAYANLEDFVRSKEFLSKAEKIFYDANDPLQLARVFQNFGTSFYFQNRATESIDYLNLALELIRTTNDRVTEIRIMIDIMKLGLLIEDTRMIDEQWKLFRSLRLKEAVNQVRGEALQELEEIRIKRAKLSPTLFIPKLQFD